MRVIITGGTGLIGRALATNLADGGHETIILSRRQGPITGLPSGTRVEAWDARTASSWGSLADGADAIVNLAGESIGKAWTATRKRRIRDSRLNAGRAVVDAVKLAKGKPSVVIQASGAGYYGPRGDKVIVEEEPGGSDFLGQVAAEWEASTVAVEHLGVRRAIIRSGLVLSTKGGSFPPMLLQSRFFLGGRLGSGRQWLPWIHVEDEARAIRFLIERENARGPHNLVAPNPVTSIEFSQLLGRVIGRPAAMPIPALALRLLVGEMSTLLLDGQRAVPQRLLDLGFAFRFADAEGALRDLLS